MMGLTILANHNGKKAGIIISAIGLILMICERLKGFIIFKKLNASQHYFIFEWIMLLGLVCIMYSKEKYEDDRAKMIRLKSIQVSFLLVLSLLMNHGLLGSIYPAKVPPMPPEILMMISAMGIILCLLMFHIGLYFDFLWEYNDKDNDNKGLWENFRNIDKNIWGTIVFLLAGAIAILLASLLST